VTSRDDSTTVADRLRERASSYFQDARRLREKGDLPMWAAYAAIADELRKIAAEEENRG